MHIPRKNKDLTGKTSGPPLVPTPDRPFKFSVNPEGQNTSLSKETDTLELVKHLNNLVSPYYQI
jgi:hypothetical protein